jgi:uncharacterized protein (TIGR02145 family)
MKLFLLLSTLYCTSILTFNDLTTKNGDQWMSKNLSVTTFKNGDKLLHAKTSKEWEQAFDQKIPAYCIYANDEENMAGNGLLYNFYAVNDERGLAPEGWHIASDSEWTKLINEFGGKSKALEKFKDEHFIDYPAGFRDIDRANAFKILKFSINSSHPSQQS